VRIIVVVDLEKQQANRMVDEGLQNDYKKIRQKLPPHIGSLCCGGHNSKSATIANLIALNYSMTVRFDRRLEDIEKLAAKMQRSKPGKQPGLQQSIVQKETVSLCMFHLQEFMSTLKKENRDDVLIVASEFGCQLLLTYALGISIDAIHAFNVNAGSVILLDIHDMTSMNKIHF
jgi:hypothetical protein